MCYSSKFQFYDLNGENRDVEKGRNRENDGGERGVGGWWESKLIDIQVWIGNGLWK